MVGSHGIVKKRERENGEGEGIAYSIAGEKNVFCRCANCTGVAFTCRLNNTKPASNPPSLSTYPVTMFSPVSVTCNRFLFSSPHSSPLALSALLPPKLYPREILYPPYFPRKEEIDASRDGGDHNVSPSFDAPSWILASVSGDIIGRMDRIHRFLEGGCLCKGGLYRLSYPFGGFGVILLLVPAH